MLPVFDIAKASSVSEASEHLRRHGEEAAVYAGGTELLLVMKHGLLDYSHLVDIKGIKELGGLEADEEASILRIGATTTHRELELSPLVARVLPVLAETESGVANVRVRNVGTLVGNLCFAEPHSDPAVLLMALGARVHIVTPSGEERISDIQDFLVDAYESAVQPGEIVSHVQVDLPSPASGSAYLKFNTHERPTIGVGAVTSLAGSDDKTMTTLRLAVGCVGPKPIRIEEAEQLFAGLSLADARVSGLTARTDRFLDVDIAYGVDFGADIEKRIHEAGRIASDRVEPYPDLHGDEAYKRHLTDVFVQRAIRLSFLRATLGRH